MSDWSDISDGSDQSDGVSGEWNSQCTMHDCFAANADWPCGGGRDVSRPYILAVGAAWREILKIGRAARVGSPVAIMIAN